MRTFKRELASRESVPLLIALIGPSGGGKTYSAMRLATGIQRVQGGDIDGISTEGQRMKELADRFRFHHVSFPPPFGSLDYLAAIQASAAAGARTVIVDSMSHEHEGPGGLLERVEADLDERVERKLKSGDRRPGWQIRQAMQMSAFIRPKADRSKLIQGMIQLPCNIILCFRAKEKIRPIAGKEPEHMGWMPIAGDEFWYEMTTRCLLPPGAIGTPKWVSDHEGERLAIRRPEQFKGILRDGRQLTEEVGEELATWATGGSKLNCESTLTQVADLTTVDSLRNLAAALRTQPWSPEDRKRIGEAIRDRKEALKGKNNE